MFRIAPFVLLLSTVFAAARSAASQAGQGAAAQAQPPPPSSDSSTTIALIGFFSTLVALLIQMWREHNQRRYERERQEAAWLQAEKERKEARDEARESAVALRDETIATAKEIAKLTRGQHERLTEWIRDLRDEQTRVIAGAVKENTALTKQVGEKADAAYGAANSFTERLAAIQGTLGAGGKTLGEVKNTVDETHGIVEQLASTGDIGKDESGKDGA